MVAPFRIKGLTFNSGSVIDTAGADVVVLVGPNNTGKSRTLQELAARLSLLPGHPIVGNQYVALSDVRMEKLLSGDELTRWMGIHRYTWINADDDIRRVRTVNANEFYLRDVPTLWDSANDRLGNLAPHFVRTMWGAERLGYVGSPGRQDADSHPEHPIHWLLRNETLFSAFREAFYSAFGMNIVVDAWGTNVRLRLSRDSAQADYEFSTTDGLPSRELKARLDRLPLIESQSDGVRSFSGIVLTLLTAQYPLVLLDEPEAFLHPPQARLLGRSFVEIQGEGQLIVATHSLDILLGLMEFRPERVMIVRLTRENDVTSAETLAPDELARLWRDPLLRFSRALDGLFHDGVVVGEGDTDSQFYNAVAEAKSGEDDIRGGRHVMFTYAGSKQRIPLITNALRVVGVPVRAIVDFDALSDEATLRTLVEGVGGQYTSEMENDRNVLDAHLRGSEPKLKTGVAMKIVSELLGDDPNREMTRSLVSDVRQALEPETGWRAAKKSGIAAVPSGQASEAVSRLLAALEKAGVFVVPSGEVESFVKIVGGKGPRWVVKVAEDGHIENAQEAHAFVKGVLHSLPGARSRRATR